MDFFRLQAKVLDGVFYINDHFINVYYFFDVVHGLHSFALGHTLTSEQAVRGLQAECTFSDEQQP